MQRKERQKKEKETEGTQYNETEQEGEELKAEGKRKWTRKPKR